VKRLYDSSLGRLEIDLDIELSIWLFDEDGRVAKESGDEWDYADLPDLLQDEIGLPEPEAQLIAASFLEDAKAEGGKSPAGAGRIGNTVAMAIVTAAVIAIGVGIWTIVTSITWEALGVAIPLFLLWILPAILILRWWDRRREKRKKRAA